MNRALLWPMSVRCTMVTMALWLCYTCRIQIRHGPLWLAALMNWKCTPHAGGTLCKSSSSSRSAHSHSIVLAFCSRSGSHASAHYLLSPPVTAVCYYGDRPCTPLEAAPAATGEHKTTRWWTGQSQEGEKGSVSDEGRTKRGVRHRKWAFFPLQKVF